MKTCTVVPVILFSFIMETEGQDVPGIDYEIQHNGVLSIGYMPYPKQEKLEENDDASASYNFPTGVSFTFMGREYSKKSRQLFCNLISQFQSELDKIFAPIQVS